METNTPKENMEATRTCKNGHTMTGIGFDDGCPECEEPWVDTRQPDSMESRFEAKFPAYFKWLQGGKEMTEFILAEKALSRAEEHQFFLNVLDGIDQADKEMGNSGGGTEAIRHALKSRYIGL